MLNNSLSTGSTYVFSPGAFPIINNLSNEKSKKPKNKLGIEAKREPEDGENTTKMAIEIVIQSRLDFYELRLQNKKRKEL